MEYSIQITVDTNDADYVTNINIISEEDLNKIMPLIEEIKKYTYKGRNKYYNYNTSECYDHPLPHEIYNFNDEIFDIFEELCPYTEYGFHTISSIKITPEIKWEILL